MYSYNAGGLKAAAKRTVFGEVTNSTTYMANSYDDSVIPTKNPYGVIGDKSTLLKHNKKPVVLQRPAHRPMSMAGLKGIFGHVPNSHRGPSKHDLLTSRKVLTKKNTTIYKDTTPNLDGLNVDLIRKQAAQAPLSIASLNLPPGLELPVHEPKPERKRLSRYASTFERLEAEKQARIAAAAPPEPEVNNLPKSLPSPVRDNYTTSLPKPILSYHTHIQPQRGEPKLTDSVKKALSATARQALLEAADDEDFMQGLMQSDDSEEDGYVTAQSYKSRGDYTTGAVTTEVVPEMTSRSRREVEAATRMVQASKSPEEVEEETWDTSMVAEYGDDIFRYMKELESKLAPNPAYMTTQPEMQWSMRAVLMDWIVQVHQRFGLLPETLFLTANLIDRFLSAKVVSLGKLQLVGATALFIAAKYEEVNNPAVEEIVFMVDSGYTKKEILKAERFMLGMLQFELGWPGPMSFLRRISKADDYDLDTRTLAKYFLEITLMDERFVGSPPSFLAAGAYHLARQLLNKGEWTAAHVHFSGYTDSQLEFLCSLLRECCEHPEKHHGAVYEKYAAPGNQRAAVFAAAEIGKG